jgi:hypothetical protein
MSSGKSVIRRGDVLCPLTYEIVDWFPIEAMHNGAPRQATVLAVHDNPLVVQL